MKQTIRVGKIKILSFLKHALFVNAVLAIFYCIIRVITVWELIFDPPNIMIGSGNVNSSPLPYIVVLLAKIGLFVFITLTILEIAALSVYNLIAQYTGGIEINVQLKDEEKK